MSTTEPLFIAERSPNYVSYELRSNGKAVPTLIRTELSELAEDQTPYLCHLKQSCTTSQLPPHLRYVTVINSVKSGLGQSSSFYFNILLPLFNDFGIPHVCVATATPNSITEHAKDFGTSGTVILFGGDTTVSEFVNGLTEADNNSYQLRIIIIPTGTGNAMATSLGVTSPIEAIKSIFMNECTWKPLTCFPITLVDKKVCSMVVFSFGLHAELVGDSDTPEMRKLGNERFKVAANALAEQDPTYYAHISGSSDNEHSYILVTPVKELEPKFTISPLGQPPDGKTLYMVRISKVSGPRFMEIMGLAYNNGAHLECPEVTYQQITGTTTLNIVDQPDARRRCCIDGRVIVVPPGEVHIGPPTYTWNKWNLLIWA